MLSLNTSFLKISGYLSLSLYVYVTHSVAYKNNATNPLKQFHNLDWENISMWFFKSFDILNLFRQRQFLEIAKKIYTDKTVGYKTRKVL